MLDSTAQILATRHELKVDGIAACTNTAQMIDMETAAPTAAQENHSMGEFVGDAMSVLSIGVSVSTRSD